MVSKEKLFILGFFAIVVLISSEVTARDLAKASSISTKCKFVSSFQLFSFDDALIPFSVFLQHVKVLDKTCKCQTSQTTWR